MADEKRIERARAFHDLYEKLAPEFGYPTRTDTRKFDPYLPNGKLMIRVVNELTDIEVAAKLREVVDTIKDNYPEDGDGLRFSIWLAGYLFTLTAEADALEGE